MGFFSVDGPLFQFMKRLLDVLIVNVLWLICSLPIITIGPATVAAFDVTLRMIDDTEGYVGRQFFKAFKANFKNGLPLGIMFVVALYAIWLDFQLLMTGEHAFLFMSMFILLIVSTIAVFLYSFALSARYENTLIKTIKNSYDICIRFYGRTLALVVVLALELVLFFFNYTMIFLFILIGPTCLFLTISGFALPFFREIEREDGAVIRKEQPKSEDQIFEDHPAEDKGIAKRAHMGRK